MKRSILIAVVTVLVSGCSGSSTPEASETPTPTATGCELSNFSFTLGTTEGAAGTSYTTLVVTNIGATACTLGSTVTAQPVSGSSREAVGPESKAAISPDHSGSIEVSPEASANTIYGISTAANYSKADCEPKSSDGVLVTFNAGGRDVNAYFAMKAYDVCTKIPSTSITGFGAGAGS